MDQRQLKNLAKLTVCGFCQQKYDHQRVPKFLPCLHTACLKCLETTPAPISCPTCRRPTAASNATANELKTSLTVLELMDVLKLYEGNHQFRCVECEDGAICRCSECNSFLCKLHQHAHLKSINTRSHTILTIDQFRKTNPQFLGSPATCPQHKQPYDFFCMQCEIPVCLACMVAQHNRHRPVVATSDVFNDFVSTIKDDLMHARDKSVALQEGGDKIQQTCDRIAQKKQETQKQIEDYFTVLQQSLEGRKRQILQDFNTLFGSRMDVLNNQIKHLQQDYSAINSSCDLIDRMLSSNQQAYALLFRKEIAQRLEDISYQDISSYLTPKTNLQVKFVSPSPQPIIQQFAQMGSLHHDGALAHDCVAYGTGLVHPRVDLPNQFAIVAYDQQANRRQVGGDPFDVTIEGPKPCKAIVKDNNDGSYTVAYSPSVAGIYRVSVTLYGGHIKGSPFDVNVESSTGMVSPAAALLTDEYDDTYAMAVRNPTGSFARNGLSIPAQHALQAQALQQAQVLQQTQALQLQQAQAVQSSVLQSQASAYPSASSILARYASTRTLPSSMPSYATSMSPQLASTSTTSWLMR